MIPPKRGNGVKSMLLSAVFSFRNEEKNLPELIRRVKASVEEIPDLDLEMIFVNDDSGDNSLSILMDHAQRDARIKIITMSRRFGVFSCLKAGFMHAKGDAVVYMDSDLQDPPELIPVLVEKWRNGADVVHTIRTKRLGENAFKMWLTRRAYALIRRVSGMELPANAGDFKLISRRALDHLVTIDEYEPYMRGLVWWIGFKQDSVHYVREARYAGEAHVPLLSKGPAKQLIAGMTSFSTVPLYFSLFMGFLVSFGAFVYLCGIIVTKMMGMHLPGWSAIMVTMLFLGGVMLFTVGVLGIYVGQIFSEIKLLRGRPSYIIESKINLDDDSPKRKTGVSI